MFLTACIIRASLCRTLSFSSSLSKQQPMHNLEVTAAYQQVNGFSALPLQVLDCVVYFIKLPMTAALNSDL